MLSGIRASEKPLLFLLLQCMSFFKYRIFITIFLPFSLTVSFSIQTNRIFFSQFLFSRSLIIHFLSIYFAVPPSIIESETSSDTIVDERQKLSLRCRASGYPLPNVTWRREDNRNISLGLYGGKKYNGMRYLDTWIAAINKFTFITTNETIRYKTLITELFII